MATISNHRAAQTDRVGQSPLRANRVGLTKNTVYEVKDPRRTAMVCLAWNENIADDTIAKLRELTEAGDKPFFICLERSLSTTSKWNLKHLLGNHFNAF